MAGERGGPPRGIGGSVVDLGSLRQSASAEPEPDGRTEPPFYANDVQPTVETDGTVTLFFQHIRGGGVSDAQAISLPPGLFLALVGMSGQILEGALPRMQAQLERVGKALQAAQGGPTSA